MLQNSSVIPASFQITRGQIATWKTPPLCKQGNELRGSVAQNPNLLHFVAFGVKDTNCPKL